ncbi:MAG: hypothetical protein IIW52_08835 [Alistipes sp.]|nr:hypothetical protein [Alistipes sp.]
MANISTINPEWERLATIIETSGLSVHAFALSIGMSRSETLYQIKRGQIGISRNVAQAIAEHYPEYSQVWIQTGMGSMYSNAVMSERYVSFFECDLANIIDVDNMTPSDYIFLPMVNYADFAITYHGQDMEPSVPNGSVLLLQKVDIQSIVYGNEYVVVTPNLTVLRRLRRGNNDGELRLEADNREKYDDIYINIYNVCQIFTVKAKIILKN